MAALFVLVLLATVITDMLNGPTPAPTYLTGLLGASATAFFAAASSDRHKREQEISDTADRAESKADDALGRSEAVSHIAATVVEVQERELEANRRALRSMYDAVAFKESQGVPVLPETYMTIAQLERQIDRLANEIEERRKTLPENNSGEPIEVNLEGDGP